MTCLTEVGKMLGYQEDLESQLLLLMMRVKLLLLLLLLLMMSPGAMS